MAPKTADFVRTFSEAEIELKPLSGPQAGQRKYEILYLNIILFSYWHLAAVYAIYLIFTSAKLATTIFSLTLCVLAQYGLTVGAHRLWSHRSFKARMPLEIFLMILNSIAFQNTATDWVRNHRLHHKYTDTDADPHNATRGMFYSHVGWLMVKKHPQVSKKGQQIEMGDIYNNPVLKFQKKYAVPLIGMVCFVLPTIIPMYFWGETFKNSWNICLLRYVLNLNVTFLVNSAAHKWGNRPYDAKMLPVQSKLVCLTTLGEGYHNYHHVFPWDYRSDEWGHKWNLTTVFINFFARIGWAYDLKVVPHEVIVKRAARTGDGSRIWGFGDKDLLDADNVVETVRN